MKKIIILLILILSLSINTVSKEKATTTKSQGNPIALYPPDFLTINGGARVDGGLLDLLSKKGRDSQARSFKITGYNISGKIDIARDFYNYFNAVIVKENDYMKKLEVFADLTTTEKESLLDEISANFIKNWDKKTVKSVISNKTDKTFNNRTKKNAYFYDDVEHKLFFNEDLADFTDTKKIIEALAYANFDYFLFYNKEDWKSWDLAYLEAWKSQNKNIKQKTELEGEVVEDTPVTPETTTPVK